MSIDSCDKCLFNYQYPDCPDMPWCPDDNDEDNEYKYTITLKIKAPSRDHLMSAIAGGLLTETFLNAASGEHDSDEWIHPDGNILFERIDHSET